MFTQTRLIILLGSLLVMGGSIIGAYFYGIHVERVSCKASALTEYQKGVEDNAEIDKAIRRMDTPSLDRTLSRWMRPNS